MPLLDFLGGVYLCWHQLKKTTTIMKRYIYLISLIVFVVSCRFKEKQTIDKIQGDWISDIIKSDLDERRLIFSFEDTLCIYGYAWGEYTRFEIKEDLLLIKEAKFNQRDIPKNKKTYVFKILTLSDDSLVISATTKETKELYDHYVDFKADKIILHKVKKKNSIIPSKISFFSSRCYGTCPSILLEIDSSKKVSFYGYAYADKEGGYTGKISMKDYSFILNKIRNLQLDSIKEDYSANWTDDQTCGVVIDYQNKVLHSRVYGFDKEPIELRILFHKLIEVYKQINLQKESIDLSNFKHKEMYNKIVPPPPPPYFDEKVKFIPPKLEDEKNKK
jgi:hypothetical protein